MRHAMLIAACLAAAPLALAVSSSRALVVSGPERVTATEAATLRRDDRGLYLAFCPHGQQAAHAARATSRSGDDTAHAAEANHEGWPRDECLKMDKGPAGRSHTLIGLQHVHNWLLGGFGNDTFYAGANGDVIWGDYHPEGQSESQHDYIHGGAGDDWIYSSHGYNEIWTGAGNDHLALVYGHGVVVCDGPGVKTFVMRYLPQNRPWRLVGCSHKVLVRYRA